MDFIRFLVLYNVFADKVEDYKLVNINVTEMVCEAKKDLLSKNSGECVMIEVNSCGKIIMSENELRRICKRILICKLLPKDELYSSIMMNI